MMLQVKKLLLYWHRCYAAWRWVISTLALNHPYSPRIDYMCNYNRFRGGMLDQKKFVRKNFESQVTDVDVDRAVW